MVWKISFLLFSLFILLPAQNRVLLHIGENGKQEVIPLEKNEKAQDAISRLESSRTLLISKSANPDGITDTLKWYAGAANSDAAFSANSFAFYHQDVAFVWFLPAAGGRVKEFWFRMSDSQDEIKKGTVRAWYADPKVATRPASVQTKYMGYYKDPTDGDGLVTPFMPATGDQWFYGNGVADSATWNFAPVGTEFPLWQKGGLQVTLDSAKWQGIKLEDWGNTMHVNLGQPFGFTLQNDAKLTDVVGGADLGMTIRYAANQNPAPYHSYKFYENGRTSAADKGWWLRGDNDWGMYVVIEYTTGCSPKIIPSYLYSTTLKTTPRDICFTVISCETIASVWLKYKVGSRSGYDSLLVVNIAGSSKYCVTLPASLPGDTVYYLFIVTDIKGNRAVFGPRTYVVFKKAHDNLFIYNNAQYSLGNTGANYIYNNMSTKLDRWSTPNDGTSELDDLLALYDNVVLCDGSFPSRDVYRNIKTWFGKGTPAAKKNLFFSSQDYGCYITPSCGDTTFAAGTLENDFLGIEKLGPQDLGPTNRPFNLVPQTDPTTNYLIKYNTDSSTTLWHNPTFELSFAGYPDGMTPKAGAKALFKDGSGINTLGVLNAGATFNSMFVAFDAGALEFRSDTSFHNETYTQITDPKYRWIADVQSLSMTFLGTVTGVNQSNDVVPGIFALGQNYPNPFNPTTTIEFFIPTREKVQISIYNILGQKVATVINEAFDAGAHAVRWNALSFANGVYFYEMQSGPFTSTKKMVLMK